MGQQAQKTYPSLYHDHLEPPQIRFILWKPDFNQAKTWNPYLNSFVVLLKHEQLVRFPNSSNNIMFNNFSWTIALSLEILVGRFVSRSDIIFWMGITIRRGSILSRFLYLLLLAGVYLVLHQSVFLCGFLRGGEKGLVEFAIMVACDGCRCRVANIPKRCTCE